MIARRTLLKYGSFAATSASLSSLYSLRATGQASSLAAVRGVYAALSPVFAGILLANELGFWSKNGLDARIRQVAGGPLSMAALTNKEADFAGTASTDPVVGWERGIKTQVIAAFTSSLAMEFTARNDWMSRVGISPTSPIEAKLKALKGARLGTSTIGGGPAQLTRYLARTVGLNPDSDMKILAVGFAEAKMAALRTNQIDIAVGDAPDADQVEFEGYGKLYLNCATDIPVFREYPYTVLIVTPEFANRQPDLTRRIAQSIGNANDVFYSDFGKAMDVMRKLFPRANPKALERAIERSKDTFPRGGRMTETMWKNIVTISQEIKLISAPIPTEEGQLWTNKYLT